MKDPSSAIKMQHKCDQDGPKGAGGADWEKPWSRRLPQPLALTDLYSYSTLTRTPIGLTVLNATSSENSACPPSTVGPAPPKTHFFFEVASLERASAAATKAALATRYAPAILQH